MSTASGTLSHPPQPTSRLTSAGHRQQVLRCPEVAFGTLTVSGPLGGWQGVCRALQTGALRSLGLEESRRAGWWAEERTSVQPIHTLGSFSGSLLWDPRQITPRACFLIGKMSSDGKMHGQHLAPTDTQEVLYPQAPSPCIIPRWLSKKHHISDPSIQGPHLT